MNDHQQHAPQDADPRSDDSPPPDDRPDAYRVAAIDIGSNSIRLTVAESRGPNSYRVVTDEKETVALAQTDERNNLDPERVARAIETITHMVTTARGYGAQHIHAVATAAVRDAPNRDAILKPLRDDLGLEVEILTGDDEARFAHASVAQAFDLTGVQAAVLDIGGGSTEVAVSASGVVERLFSAPIGAVRLTNRFPEVNAGSHPAFAKLRAAAERELERALDRSGIRPAVVFGTGGTFTSLADIIINQRHDAAELAQRPAPVRGFEVRLAELNHIIHDLRRLTPDERKRVKGLSEARADIIIAGLTIAECAMRKLGVNTLRVHDRGVRDGVLLHLINQRFADTDAARSDSPRLDAVLAFGKRCDFERRQSQHVAKLALELFDQLASLLARDDQPPAWATPVNRELLHYAALLRDVGYFINYTKHHKHSYHLIIHSELPGFSPAELERIALLARYHRKAPPKKKHDAFGKLDKPERAAVKALVGILRLADGLDRTHAGRIQSLSLHRDDDRIHIAVHADSDPAPELWGARRKAAVLEDALKLDIDFQWRERDAT